jgi:hypothetical protein
MNIIRPASALGLAVLLLAAACSPPAARVRELANYPADGLEGVITRTGVEVDPSGGLRLSASGPTVVHLYETGDLDVENARLIYQARLRTEGVEGQCYLEMWCHFAGRGEFFSRGIEATLSGTNGWSTQETPFLLRAGENPDNVKLNVVFTGRGTAWIEGVKLLQGPLN